MRRAAVASLTGTKGGTVASCSTAANATLTSRRRTTANASYANAAVAARRRAPSARSPERLVCVGAGVWSPALFRPTAISRIPPQLARFLIASGAAVLQVFVVAYQRESRKLRQEERARGAVGGTQCSTATRSSCAMSAIEAVQVLGLDCDFPDLCTSTQQAEANSMPKASLPLVPGKARTVAQQNFERMFALAVKEEHMFLAGKLSAAYRICVDPAWDQATPNEGEESADTRARGATEPNADERGRSF
ncbi:hypothetical protein LSCM1_00988 [Leishmania martiniquensis]|uniref:Uncharacterized protein n=1 Tax=Leishmania martiniquensis TaxID=1580590 RepID=A0A836GX97_9TRYP|nr:hypothetical protein LSCM1_00988 [Leishmania martiniquensis]